MNRRNGLPITLALSVMLLTLGCWARSVMAKDYPDEQHKAGGVYVSALTPMPFGQYASQLAPAMSLSFADAMKRVAASSSTDERIERDMFSILVKLGMTDQALAPMDLVGQSEAPQTPGSGLGGLKGTETKTSMPGMMQYQAALALYQEVKLLEKSILKGVWRKGYTPYIVRAQITLDPFKRNLPLDVYSTISFFGAQDTKGVTWADSNATSGLDSYNIQNSAQLPSDASDDLPLVLPLIVTENIEVESFSHTSQKYREYGLALVAAWQNLGGKVGFDKVINKLRQATGNDYNTLHTTARITENTVRVRLGAMRSSNGDNEYGYEMVPRNYMVSFLLLVPNENVNKKMQMVANSVMRGPDGEVLEDWSVRELEKAADRIIKGSIYPGVKRIHDDAYTYFYGAVNAVQMNDKVRYKATVKEMVERLEVKNNYKRFNPNYERLWTEIARFLAGGRISYTTLDIKEDKFVAPPATDGKYVLSIGEKALFAEFSGGENLFGQAISVDLAMGGEGKNASVIHAKQIKPLHDGTGFVAIFDAPEKTGLPLDYIATNPRASVVISPVSETTYSPQTALVDDNANCTDSRFQPFKYSLSPQMIREKGKKVTTVLKVETQAQLPLAKGATTAKLVLNLSGTANNKSGKEMVIRIMGASEKGSAKITSHSGATLSAVQKNGWRLLSGDGRFDVDLINLYSGQLITIMYGLQPKEKPKNGKPKPVSDQEVGAQPIVISTK